MPYGMNLGVFAGFMVYSSHNSVQNIGLCFMRVEFSGWPSKITAGCSETGMPKPKIGAVHRCIHRLQVLHGYAPQPL